MESNEGTYISVPISIARRNSKSINNYGDIEGTYGSIITADEFPNDCSKSSKAQKSSTSPFNGPNSLKRFQSSYQRANSFKSIEANMSKERSYFNKISSPNDSSVSAYDQLIDYDTMGASIGGRRLSIALNGRGSLSKKTSIADLSNDDFVMREPIAVQTSDPSNPLLNPSYQDNDFAVRSQSHKINDINSIIIQRLKAEKLDNKVVIKIVGQSTKPQTIFNSVNVLIGIGLFALPLGLKYSGWYLGIPMLVLFAVGTLFTAELLSKCLDTDPSLISYGDLGYASFGPLGRALISVLFSLDLLGAGVSLFILFGDSLNALFPEVSITSFKLLGFVIICPLSLVPLRVLSNVSLMGITSTLGTIFIIFFCGIWKNTAPGSLHSPCHTNWWPESFKNFCLSIGLLSACWGGHAIFPNLKNDMRHPKAFKSCLKYTYLITSAADIGTAVFGFLMFGSGVDNEITKNILGTSGYPKFVYYAISSLMSIIPLAKTPLNSLPIVSLLDTITGINASNDAPINEEDEQAIESEYEDLTPKNSQLSVANEQNKSTKAGLISCLNKVIVNGLFLATSILYPDFDKILALLGAGLCFVICFILPCLFYMIMCKNTIKQWEFCTCCVIIFISLVLSVLGVGAAVL